MKEDDKGRWSSSNVGCREYENQYAWIDVRGKDGAGENGCPRPRRHQHRRCQRSYGKEMRKGCSYLRHDTICTEMVRRLTPRAVRVPAAVGAATAISMMHIPLSLLNEWSPVTASGISSSSSVQAFVGGFHRFFAQKLEDVECWKLNVVSNSALLAS